MSKFGTIEEILEFAISREEEAYEFYTALAAWVKNPTIGLIFEKFAEEELGHKAQLELEMMKEGTVVATELKISGLRTEDYLVNVEFGPDMDYKEMLALAVQKERRSFRLYVDMATIVEKGPRREALLSLAEEEARHMARFQVIYDDVVLEES